MYHKWNPNQSNQNKVNIKLNLWLAINGQFYIKIWEFCKFYVTRKVQKLLIVMMKILKNIQCLLNNLCKKIVLQTINYNNS